MAKSKKKRIRKDECKPLTVKYLKETLSRTLIFQALLYYHAHAKIGKFRTAHDWFLVYGGKHYSSKPVVATALAFFRCKGEEPPDDPEQFPVLPCELNGGQDMRDVLEHFEFVVTVDANPENCNQLLPLERHRAR